MLWHRQAIFESKGDKLPSSAECRIRTQRVSGTESPADWMPADKPTELSRIKLKNLNSTAHPYDQRAFSPLYPTAIWHSHLALAIYMFVVVNFDALAQASDFRIERRQVVFLCWMQDSKPEGLWNRISSRLNASWQTYTYQTTGPLHSLIAQPQRQGFPVVINTLRPRQNGCRLADDTFKCIFLNENVKISIKISLKLVPKGPINDNTALVQIMAWRWSADIIWTNDG